MTLAVGNHRSRVKVEYFAECVKEFSDLVQMWSHAELEWQKQLQTFNTMQKYGYSLDQIEAQRAVCDHHQEVTWTLEHQIHELAPGLAPAFLLLSPNNMDKIRERNKEAK